MKIMSVNCGSSSLKFSIFEMDNKELIASGYFERVGLGGSFYTIKFNGKGMPKIQQVDPNGYYGDYYVTFKYLYPEKFTEEQRNKLKELW